MKKSLATCLLLATAACSTQQKSDDHEQVEESLLTRRADFRDCYNKGQTTSTKGSGKVVTSFVIGPDGKVSKAEIVSSTLNQPPVETCIVRTIQSITFSPPKGSEKSVVTYPFSFRPD